MRCADSADGPVHLEDRSPASIHCRVEIPCSESVRSREDFIGASELAILRSKVCDPGRFLRRSRRALLCVDRGLPAPPAQRAGIDPHSLPHAGCRPRPGQVGIVPRLLGNTLHGTVSKLCGIPAWCGHDHPRLGNRDPETAGIRWDRHGLHGSRQVDGRAHRMPIGLGVRSTTTVDHNADGRPGFVLRASGSPDAEPGSVIRCVGVLSFVQQRGGGHAGRTAERSWVARGSR